MKKDDKITIICKMVRQIIDEDKLADEAEIRRILEEKGKKEEEDRGICLASVIENELEKAIQSGQICEEHVGLYKSIFEKMIRESEIGNMPAKELSDILIKKFVLQAGKVYERDRTRLKCFTGMLQTGLNKMAEEDMLRFVPDRHIYRNYLIYPDKEIHYIDNPYTDAETEKIKEWIDLHTNDIRGLALGLWFTGNATLLEIVNLKKEDARKGIFKKWKKARFISKALELNPKNGDYVFMTKSEGNLEKLTAQGLMMKLYHICNKLGIKYKKINKNEAMVCKE
ncbi:MAG: hypothetical protein K1W24_03655 [Lachnospiraceae bacterium]